VSAVSAVVQVTLRGLLGRRRMLLMLLLAALPVLVGLLIRAGGGRADAPEILDTLVIRTVLPLVALIVGTAAIGGEMEDGTLVYLLTKPIRRWRLAIPKIGVAACLTLVLVIPPMLVAGVLMSGLGSEAVRTTLGFAAAAALGGIAYAAVFTCLGALTSRALVIGLAYTLLWEGVLAGLLEGTRFLSIRQATLGLAAAWTGEDTGIDALDPMLSTIVILVAVVGGSALTTLALARFQLRTAD
jgi:ABC-2 type transport system permease protein